jgi:predicted enzyme related to lactoylglutathione lyase
MGIRRIVPNIVSAHPDLCQDFYAGFLGLRVAMDMGWIVTYVSPDNPTAQISVVRGEASPAADRSISLSVEVADVDAAHREAVARGYSILYPLTDEPWGVRRFHVADPNGVVVNVMCHLPTVAAGHKQAGPNAAAAGGGDEGSSEFTGSERGRRG